MELQPSKDLMENVAIIYNEGKSDHWVKDKGKCDTGSRELIKITFQALERWHLLQEHPQSNPAGNYQPKKSKYPQKKKKKKSHTLKANRLEIF